MGGAGLSNYPRPDRSCNEMAGGSPFAASQQESGSMMPQYFDKVSHCVLRVLVVLFVLLPLAAAAEKAQEKVVYLIVEESRLIASN